jgi:hypothetical protein
LSLFDSDDEDSPQTFLRVSHGIPDDIPASLDLLFSLYTSSGDPAEAYGISTKRNLTNTSSSLSFETVISWIEDCQNNHHLCSRKLPLKDAEHEFQTWPARLLDLEAFDKASPDIKLVDNDASAKKYFCLSYCWGNSKTFITTARSLRFRKSRIKFDSLPTTFRDAVKIARELKIKWMWIDALCIIQDDRKDWERESVKMGAIYSMAYATIAADAGSDSDAGCFNIKSVSQDLTSGNTPFELASSLDDGTESKIYLWDPARSAPKTTTPEIDGSPLSERGWVCQERILSPRILHYTDTQLFWECRQVLKAEDNLQVSGDTVCGLARSLYGSTTDPIGRANLLGIWYNAVVAQSYSRRKLTRPEDKLSALSGIARAFGRHFRTTYLAGLWYQDLPWGLSWRRKGLVVAASSYRAPSFSWAAYDAPVEWPALSMTQTSRLKVLSIDITLRGSDPFGQVSNCSLKVEGYVYSASVTPHKQMTPGGVDLTWQLRGARGEWGQAFVDEASAETTIEVIVETEYLILSHDDKSKHTRALLLEKTSVDDQYRRKGVAEIHGFAIEDSDYFDEKSRRKLTLI